MKTKLMGALLCVVVMVWGCKKTSDQLQTSQTQLQQSPAQALLPTVRVDKFFPNGVLEFKTSADIKSFWEKVQKDVYYANKVINNFKVLQNSFDAFHAGSSNGNKVSFIQEMVSNEEFLYDENSTTLPDPSLGGILNPDMQVVVDNTLYQFTRIGVFQVDLNYIQDFANVYGTNQQSIIYDPNFVAMPNETPLGDGQYLVAPGIQRMDGILDIFRPMTYLEDNGGYGGGGGGVPGTSGTPDYHVNTAINPGNTFDKEVAVVWNDFAKRRLVFNAETIDIALFGLGFHKISVKAKVQREKKILWITYWGESFADELNIGCDNMNLQTDYYFPFPYNFSVMPHPTFEGLADFDIGNLPLKLMNIRVNTNVLGFSLNNSQISSFINSQFNTLVGNTYNDIFKGIENNVINAIDPSYLSTYAAYTKRLYSLKEDNRLKWVIGKAEKPQGYSSDNLWWFDYNFGISLTYNGGVGGYPLQYTYQYDMKGGSFYARARVGNVWHGIRIVKL